MAGAGYKLFVTGDVLTAAQVNTYLMQQTVMVFASATARDTALSGILAEGLCCYLTDINDFQIYDGASWISYGSGDITGITTGATSGLTGGVTSGTANLKLNTTAKGGLLVGTGSGTVSELAVGTNNYVLTADSTQATGVKWAAAAGGGKVLQVVQGSYATAVTIASSAYADTGLTVSITPTATTSKVLVLVNLSGCGISGSSSAAAAQFKLFRGTTEIQLIEMAAGWTNSLGSTMNIIGSVAASYLDSPATTSATSYKIQIASKSGENQASMNFNYANAYSVTPKSTITVLEIGA